MSEVKNPIRILIIVSGIIPSSIIGVLLPLVELEKAGYVKLKLMIRGKFNFLIRRWIKKSDVIIFSRNCEIVDLTYLYYAKKQGKRVIFEMDDNFFNMPLSLSLGRYHRQFFRLCVIKRFFELSDLVRVYSKGLYQIAHRYGSNVSLKRLYFNTDCIRDLAKPKKNGVIKIAYPTTRVDDSSTEYVIYSAIKNILVKYQDKVELHLWKNEIPELLINLNNVILHSPELNYTKFIVSFYSAGYDIGLAPLMDHPFFNDKTNNKYRELSGCGVAAVYANQPLYSDCVQHGVNGLLADNSIQSWENQITVLIEDEKLRQKIIDNSARDIAANYQLNHFVDEWKNDIEHVMTLKNESIVDQPNVCISGVLLCRDKMGDEVNQAYPLARVAQLLDIHYHCVDYQRVEMKVGDLSTAVVYVIENDQCIEFIREFICNSPCTILDFSIYTGSIDRIGYNYIKEISRFKNVTVISDNANLELNENFNAWAIPYVPVDTRKLDCYCLNGYSAVYFTLLERISILRKEDKIFITTYFKKCISYFNLFTDKMKRAFYLFKWAIGLRPL